MPPRKILRVEVERSTGGLRSKQKLPPTIPQPLPRPSTTLAVAEPPVSQKIGRPRLMRAKWPFGLLPHVPPRPRGRPRRVDAEPLPKPASPAPSRKRGRPHRVKAAEPSDSLPRTLLPATLPPPASATEGEPTVSPAAAETEAVEQRVPSPSPPLPQVNHEPQPSASPSPEAVPPPHTAPPRAGPPSLAGCLAACFGWRLACDAVAEDGSLQFSLRHVLNEAVTVAVEASREALEATPDVRGAPAVVVNGRALSLAACAAYLQQIQKRGVLAERAGRERSVTSPTAQPPPEPVAPAAGEDTAVLGSAWPPLKRPRTCSPPQQAHRRTEASPDREAELQVEAETELEGQAEAGAEAGVVVAPAAEADTEARPEAAAETETERESEEMERGEGAGLVTAPTQATAHCDGEAQLDGTPTPSPPSLPPSSRVAAAVPVKEEEEVPASPTPPAVSIPRTPPPQSSETHTDEAPEEATDTTADPLATAVKTEPLAQSSLAARRARIPTAITSLVRRALARAKPRKAKMRSLPLLRIARASAAPSVVEHGLPDAAAEEEERRGSAAMLLEAAASTGASDGVSPSAVAHSSPSSSSLALQHSTPRRSFQMPCISLAGTGIQPPATASAGSGVVFTTPWFCGTDGWTVLSSRSWLAHTHAVSRTLALPPANNTEEAGAAVVVAVRIALRGRWLRQSALWAKAEESLRLSVGSGRLRGDALEAGVAALQAGERELLHYCGMPLARTAAGEDVLGEMPLLRFPTPHPRPLLPVSGKAIVQAQHRIAGAEEVGGSNDTRSRGALAPCYAVCQGGIPAAYRLVIDRTYTARGSYVVAAAAAPFVCGEGVKCKESGAVHAVVVPLWEARLALPLLRTNPLSDLYNHVYKRFPAPNMNAAPEGEEEEGSLGATAGSAATSLAKGASPLTKDDDSDEDNGHGEGGTLSKRRSLPVAATAPTGVIVDIAKLSVRRMLALCCSTALTLLALPCLVWSRATWWCPRCFPARTVRKGEQ